MGAIKDLSALQTKLYSLVKQGGPPAPQDLLKRIQATETAKARMFLLLEEQNESARQALAHGEAARAAVDAGGQIAGRQLAASRRALSDAQQQLIDKVRLTEIRDYELERMRANRSTLFIMFVGLVAIAVELAIAKAIPAATLPAGVTEFVVGGTAAIAAVLVVRRVIDAYARSALVYSEYDFGNRDPAPGAIVVGQRPARPGDRKGRGHRRQHPSASVSACPTGCVASDKGKGHRCDWKPVHPQPAPPGGCMKDTDCAKCPIAPMPDAYQMARRELRQLEGR